LFSKKIKADFLTERGDWTQSPSARGPGTQESEADMPVPDRLLPKWKTKVLLHQLKLSQQIGLLLWLNRENLLSSGGEERLLYLQRRATIVAIQAGLRFAQRLSEEVKLQSDFKHQMIELNRRPQSKRYRKSEVSRIGVGYRDKGTLPEISMRPRLLANEEQWVFFSDFNSSQQRFISHNVPTAVEGEWVDLEILSDLLRESRNLKF
jgi:hypothetical protein